MKELRLNLLNEISELRKMGYRFINKELSAIEFKREAGRLGVRAEKNKDTFILMFRIPSGVMSIDEMQWILKCAEANNMEQIHFTTRQSIQFHGLSIDSVCDLMEEGLEHDIYTGGGGYFPKNIVVSPLSGIEKGEAFDVTPYALEVNEYFKERIIGHNFPRKLKISFSNGDNDSANCMGTDLGFLAVNKNVEMAFKVYIGGRLGLNPKEGLCLEELCNPEEILYYIEALSRLFASEGGNFTKKKIRIKHIIERMGEEEFKECFNKHLREVKEEAELSINIKNIEYLKEGEKTNIQDSRLVEQKQEGLYSVYFHPVGGHAYVNDLKEILYVIEQMEDVELRLTPTGGIYIRNLKGKEAECVLKATEGRGGETRLTQSISCMGSPICQMGIGASQVMLKEILEYFKGKNYSKDILPRIHISGCGNSCALQQGALMGLTGKKKKVNDVYEDGFELYINGIFGEENTKMTKIYGVLLVDVIPQFMYELALNIEARGICFEEYIREFDDEIIKLIEKFN